MRSRLKVKAYDTKEERMGETRKMFEGELSSGMGPCLDQRSHFRFYTTLLLYTLSLLLALQPEIGSAVPGEYWI